MDINFKRLKMEKISRSEVQFGSLIDLSPEELEMACAATWQTSTPKPTVSADSGIASLTMAVEELTKMIGQQNQSFTDRLNKIEGKMVKLEKGPSEKKTDPEHRVKYVPIDDRQHNEDELSQALDQIETFSEFTLALSTRFGNKNRMEMFRTTLKSRTKQKNETLQELAQSIRRLTRNAYPQAPMELREILAKDTFVDALEDINTEWKIRQSRPGTLNQALDIAVELEAFQVANRQRSGPQLRAVQTEDSKTMADLKAQLKKLRPTERRRQEG